MCKDIKVIVSLIMRWLEIELLRIAQEWKSLVDPHALLHKEGNYNALKLAVRVKLYMKLYISL